jgi:DNA-binding IclR family transcriptional regulator
MLRFAGGEYGLGECIITLDYHLRISNPPLKAGQPIMHELAGQLGFDTVMSRWYGDALVDPHR